jgi:hypothetical protein
MRDKVPFGTFLGHPQREIRAEASLRRAQLRDDTRAVPYLDVEAVLHRFGFLDDFCVGRHRSRWAIMKRTLAARNSRSRPLFHCEASS